MLVVVVLVVVVVVHMVVIVIVGVRRRAKRVGKKVCQIRADFLWCVGCIVVSVVVVLRWLTWVVVDVVVDGCSSRSGRGSWLLEEKIIFPSSGE